MSKARERGYFTQKEAKVLKIVNIVVLCILSLIMLCVISYNAMMLIINEKGAAQQNNYPMINDNYFVPVTSNAWQEYCAPFSLIVVSSEQITLDNAVKKGQGQEKVLYLVKKQNFNADRESTYVTYYLGEITAIAGQDGDETFIINDHVHAQGSDILGTVSFVVPVVAIFGEKIFVIVSILLFVCYLAVLIYFASTNLGYSLLFANKYNKSVDKTNRKGLKNAQNFIKQQTIKTSEQKVESLLGRIITDSDKSFADKHISPLHVYKALLVIGERNYSTKEKIFTILAALNLINAYIKQPYAIKDMKNNYHFKKDIPQILKDAEDAIPNALEAYVTNDHVVIVDCLGMQFSFHNLNVGPIYQIKEWIGIKLQPYACKIFDLFYDSEFTGYNFEEQEIKLSKMKAKLLNEESQIEQNNEEENFAEESVEFETNQIENVDIENLNTDTAQNIEENSSEEDNKEENDTEDNGAK